jgi:hypothetical protein
MSGEYRATPEQWAVVEGHANSAGHYCLLELRARVEALEAAANLSAGLTSSNHPAAPDSSLVKRVHSCIVGEPPCGHMRARAAIREVAAAARDLRFTTAKALIDWLEREADRG